MALAMLPPWAEKVEGENEVPPNLPRIAEAFPPKPFMYPDVHERSR